LSGGRRGLRASITMNEIDAQLALGVELFNRGEFFEAHEAMEDAMNLLDDDTSDWDFYLGLLRASVANHKQNRTEVRKGKKKRGKTKKKKVKIRV